MAHETRGAEFEEFVERYTPSSDMHPDHMMRAAFEAAWRTRADTDRERIDLIRNELQLLGYELSEAGLRRGDAAYDRGSKIFKLIDEMHRAARQDARRKEDK